MNPMLCSCSVVNAIHFKKRKAWSIKSNRRIRTALRHMRRCSANYKADKSNILLLKLVQAKVHLTKLVEEQENLYQQVIVNSLKDNPRNYWSYVNSRLSNKHNFLNKLKVNDKVIKDPQEIAENLNNHFYSKFNSNANDICF